jgi:glycosyltransferase involved in cell wall biosynthesis
MEALCMGTPLIASDCIGLQETVDNTPAMVFSSENVNSLVELMLVCMQNNNIRAFRQFIPEARSRYDVEKSAQELVKLIENLQEWK